MKLIKKLLIASAISSLAVTGLFAGNTDLVKKYSSKIIACHLKDFFSSDLNLLNHDSQCPIGDGFIDWKTVLTEIKKTNCKVFALEHDDPKDYKEYVTRSVNFLYNLSSIFNNSFS